MTVIRGVFIFCHSLEDRSREEGCFLSSLLGSRRGRLRVEAQPVIPVFGRLRQEDFEFEASLCYTVKLCLKTTKKEQGRGGGGVLLVSVCEEGFWVELCGRVGTAPCQVPPGAGDVD